MAEVSTQEHERRIAPALACAGRLKAAGLSIEEAQRAFLAFSEAARKIELPQLPEIARIRMRRMRAEHGMARFLMPSWWRWSWIVVRPNAKLPGGEASRAEWSVMQVTAKGTNMGNMSYCRFQNTLNDLRDCAEALDEIGDNLAELSKDEARAAAALIVVCQEIGGRFDEATNAGRVRLEDTWTLKL